MYSIDINLLKDHPDYGQEVIVSGDGDGGDKIPLYLGFAFAGSLVGLVMATFGIVTLLNQNLVAKEAALEAQLSELAPELSEVDNIQAEEQQVKTETQALARIFNQIRPWSATLQDIRDRVPAKLQITKIEQKSNQVVATPGQQPSSAGTAEQQKANQAAPAAGLSQPSQLTISGKTLSFGEINDFVLTLRKSPFLKGDNTQLVKSERKAKKDQGPATALVDYELSTEIGDVPATELLQVLKAKGAKGLVTRIETLKRQGVIQP